MNKTIEFLINSVNHGERVDIYLSKNINKVTRSYIKKQIKDKKLSINGKVISSPSTKIRINDKILFSLVQNEDKKLIPKRINIEKIYEDNDILVINKPKGMVVHPGAGNYENTLANALAYKYKDKLSDIGGKLRPGIVHRIDKETSGLLVIAKNNIAHSELGKQFSVHSIKRKYQCLVWGILRPLSGRIETFISRNKKNRQLMQVSLSSGKKSITNYKTVKVYNIKDIPKISLVECELETGRTHQIRVHLKFKGSSILGDNQYGKRKIFKKINQKFLLLLNQMNGQALHAQTLEFIHPTEKKLKNFEVGLPKDFKKMLNLLNKLSS